MSRQHFKIGKGISLNPVTSRPVDPENGDLIYNQSTSQFEKYENGNWTKLDNDTGATNLVTNGNAENAVQVWTPYNDRINLPAADRRPVDGVGGTPTVTSNFIVSTPINGTRSFLLQKPSGDCQGQGWSISNIQIPLEFRAKPLRHYLAYLVSSGTFAAGSEGSSPTDGDLIVYWYDQQNGKLVESSCIKFYSNSVNIVDYQEGTVQFDSNVTQVRMILHIASQSTAAWELIVDSARLEPQVVNTVAIRNPVGTIIAHSSTTPPTGYLYCNGQAVSRTQYAALFAAIGTTYGAGDGSTTFNVPDARGRFMRGANDGSGRDPDAASRTAMNSGGATGDAVGSVQNDIFGSHTHIQDPHGHTDTGHSHTMLSNNGFTGDTFNSNARSRFIVGGNVATSTASAVITNTTATNQNSGGNETRPKNFNVAYHICFDSGTVKLSEPGDGRIITAYGSKITGAHTANNSWQDVTNYALSATSSLGNFNGTTGVFTVTTAGDYPVTATASFAANATGGRGVRIIKSGQLTGIGNFANNAAGFVTSVTCAGIVRDCVAGDTIYVQAFQNSGGNLNYNTTGDVATIFAVEKSQGSQAIAAGERVNAIYRTGAGQVIPHNANTIINFNTKEVDNFGLVTTGAGWRFTSQTSAIYEVSALVMFDTGGGWNAAEEVTLQIFKNNSAGPVIGSNFQTATHSTYVAVTGAPRQIELNSGEFFDLRMFQFSGASISLIAQDRFNWISIKKVN